MRGTSRMDLFTQLTLDQGVNGMMPVQFNLTTNYSLQMTRELNQCDPCDPCSSLTELNTACLFGAVKSPGFKVKKEQRNIADKL